MSILVDESTAVIVQGITGREATTFTRSMIEYGTRVLAGVTPGKGGQDVYGVPVYDTVKEAVRSHPDTNTSIISVPPAVTMDAALEAVDAGIRLFNVFTERVPRHDVCQMIEYARWRGARIVGPNSLGMCSPGKAKLGAVGGPAAECRKAYIPGPVAILSRSGGMLTETASLLAINGIGISTAINVGGDPIIGSTFVDLLPLLGEDPETKVVVLFCEPGTSAEERLAEWVLAINYPKPIVAFVTGRFVDDMPGMRFGHAAVIVEGDTGSARGKMKAMREAGVTVVEAHDDIAGVVGDLLARMPSTI